METTRIDTVPDKDVNSTTGPGAHEGSIIPVPLLSVPADIVNDYWNDLARYDLLKLRLCDVNKPGMSDVKTLIHHAGKHMYLVWDTDLKRITAEFALENFIGRAAQIHFSVSPKNKPRQSLATARITTDIVLNDWKSRNDNQPYLDTLYGLTPVTNRGACAFVQRVGFKKIGILPNGQMQSGVRAVDALITIKTRSEVTH